MIQHTLVQGSQEWHDFRDEPGKLNASEAPAMMGVNPNMSRNELLRLKKTGIKPAISPAQQAVFDRGHRVEALARPIAEEIIGEDLYPIIGSREVEGLDLSASFDGLTLLHDINFEHKQWNKTDGPEYLAGAPLKPKHYWQVEQQMLISGADTTLFVMSDGTIDNFAEVWYESVPERREQLIMGWQVFLQDLNEYEVKVEEPDPVVPVIPSLPALMVRVTGSVNDTNIAIYKDATMAFIESINTELATDQDFVDAEETTKFCKSAEQELDLVKSQALQQTADIAKIFDTIDEIKESLRRKRLTLEGMIKSEKQTRKNKIINEAIEVFRNSKTATESQLDIRIPDIAVDFYGVVKGKKKLSSIQSAVDDELARAKSELSIVSTRILTNKQIVMERAKDKLELFPDLMGVITKDTDDLELLVSSRLSAYEERVKAEAVEGGKKPVDAVVAAKELDAAHTAASVSESNASVSAYTAPTQMDWSKLEDWRKRSRVSKKAFEELKAIIETEFLS
jgi:predicted phage-related endonuclease